MTDDELCNQREAFRERAPLTITEVAIEAACAILGVAVFIAMLALIGAR